MAGAYACLSRNKSQSIIEGSVFYGFSCNGAAAGVPFYAHGVGPGAGKSRSANWD